MREPLHSHYRGYQIVGFPPPSSGGVHVAADSQYSRELRYAEIDRKQDPIEATHIMAEAFKLAFADRAHWLGDADFVVGAAGADFERELRKAAGGQDRSEARDRRAPTRLAAELEPGCVRPAHDAHCGGGCSGNWVAITATVNTTFGSKVIVPGTGVVLNDEMDDFSIFPGTPNAFGLVGAENNSVAPGKRPLSSMSPTIVLDKEGKPVLTVGAAGGPKIITQVVLAIIRVLDYQQSLPEAVEGRRFHHQWRPNAVSYEKGSDDKGGRGAARRGHNVEEIESGGRTQAIAVWIPDGKLVGVADPRSEGKAAGD